MVEHFQMILYSTFIDVMELLVVTSVGRCCNKKKITSIEDDLDVAAC